MSTTPTTRFYNSDDTFIDRAMNTIELAQYVKDKAEAQSDAQIQAQADAGKAAAQAKLAALGLTSDDLKALGL